MKKVYTFMVILLSGLSSFAQMGTSFTEYKVQGQFSSTIDSVKFTVSVFMPQGTDLSILAPMFTVSEGASASIDGVNQVSGTMVDFSNGSKEYKIVNGTSEQLWRVTTNNMVHITFNVDMHGSGLLATDTVCVGGSFNKWADPIETILHDVDGDSIYSSTILVKENFGNMDYKYCKNSGWGGGQEWPGGQGIPDRLLVVGETDIVIDPADIWANGVVSVTFNVDMKGSGMVVDGVVGVSGDFLDWNIATLLDVDGDSIYSGILYVMKNYGVNDYSYEINNWETETNMRKMTIAASNMEVNDIWIEMFTAVNENTLSLVSMYPNPVNGKLNIANLDGVSQVIVSNILGQRLVAKNVTDSTMEIITTELRTGIYMVMLVSKYGITRSERIVKQ